MHINFNSNGVGVTSMSEEKRLKPWQGVILGIILLIVGGIVLSLGIKEMQDKKNKEGTYKELKADVVTYVDDYGTPYTESIHYHDEDQTWRAVISYTVNGVKYSATATVGVGSVPTVITPVTIYYNVNNPNDILWSGNNGSIISLIVGGVFTLLGAYLIIKGIISGKNGEEYV